MKVKIMARAIKEYDARLDSKKRLTLRGAKTRNKMVPLSLVPEY